jgi:Secretion system C-terminal sorting domain
MKTNFTFLKNMVTAFIAITITVSAKADNNPPTLSFTSTPTLVSGTGYEVGAVYKFQNVANGADALVTIISATGGATVAMLDDNNLTKPEAFSPRITVPANSTGMVKFRIDFINGGGNPRNLTQFTATAMDIDGTSGTMYEMDAINMGVGSTVSYLSALLEINVQLNGTEFLGTNVAGVEYPDVDTSAKQVMFSVTSPAIINSFTYAAGVQNLSTEDATRQKGIYFKGFDYLSFLPVKYSSFNAYTANSAVNLKWVTETEVNNHHFEVERSADGLYFKTLGVVTNGTISSNTGKSYQFIDNTVNTTDVKVVYYRLKQVDADGRYSYSNILVVRLQALSGASMQVMPNPFAESITVRFNAAEKTSALVKIMNTQGQTVMMQNTTVNKGNNSIQVSGLNKLAPGTYIACLYADGIIAATQKIIKN